MLLKTFLKKLEVQPTKIRHDNYENKDILEFDRRDGYFPYLEFQSQPKNNEQKIYFDVLNWENIDSKERYVTEAYAVPDGFTFLQSISKYNQLSTIDNINERLHAFYMLFD